MIDSHCHLNFNKLSKNFDNIIKNSINELEKTLAHKNKFIQ